MINAKILPKQVRKGKKKGRQRKKKDKKEKKMKKTNVLIISTVPQTSRLRFIYFLKCWTEQFSQQFACIVVSNWFDAFNFRLSVHWLIECLVASLLRGKLPIRHQSDVMTALPHHSTRTSQRMTLSPLSAITCSESESKNEQHQVHLACRTQ